MHIHTTQQLMSNIVGMTYVQLFFSYMVYKSLSKTIKNIHKVLTEVKRNKSHRILFFSATFLISCLRTVEKDVSGHKDHLDKESETRVLEGHSTAGDSILPHLIL